MFEKANRMKLRFASPKGALSVEDLWDVPLLSRDDFSLDVIAKSVNKKIKELEEESFVTTRSATSNVYTLKLDILKHVIGVKITERDAKKDLVAKKAKKEKILEIMAKKQDSSLEEKSIEDLQKELDNL